MARAALGVAILALMASIAAGLLAWDARTRLAPIEQDRSEALAETFEEPQSEDGLTLEEMYAVSD